MLFYLPYKMLGLYIFGLCRGKKLYDKRDSIAKAESDREIERRLKDKTYRN